MKYEIIGKENGKVIFQITEMSKDGLAIAIAKFIRTETLGL